MGGEEVEKSEASDRNQGPTTGRKEPTDTSSPPNAFYYTTKNSPEGASYASGYLVSHYLTLQGETDPSGFF